MIRTHILELLDVPLSISSVKEILEAGERARIQRRNLPRAQNLSHSHDSEESRKSIAMNAMYKLNLDSDSDHSLASDDEDKMAAPKEILEPAIVLRGFVTM